MILFAHSPNIEKTIVIQVNFVFIYGLNEGGSHAENDITGICRTGD